MEKQLLGTAPEINEQNTSETAKEVSTDKKQKKKYHFSAFHAARQWRSTTAQVKPPHTGGLNL